MFAFEPIMGIANIKDDMTNCTAGYSFVMDPANSVQGAYLKIMKRASIKAYESLITNGRWS